MAKNEISYWKSLLITLAIAVGGWAVFSLARYGVEEALLKYGIDSPAMQYAIIITFVVLILALAGYGVKGAINRVVGKK